MNKSKFPIDFIIIGTMKSGTSSLSYYMGQHESIAIPPREVHYFDRNLEKGNDWYKNLLLKQVTNNDQLIGEKTPAYCWKEVYAEQIHQLQPDVKIIWIFRNPVDRLYSHYLHNYKSGNEYLSISKAIKREQKRIKKDIYHGYYFASSYTKQIKLYLKYFPLEQMYFMLFEDLKENPINELNKLYNFLGIKNIKAVKNEVRNKTIIPQYPFILLLSRRIFGRESRVWNWAYRLNYSWLEPSNSKPEFPEQLKSELKEKFQSEKIAFERLTGLDTEVWWK